MNAPDKWTEAEIDSRLDNLFGELDPQSGTDAQLAYQDAAAVLASFDPSRLNPVSGGAVGGQSIEEAIGRSHLASISTDTSWVLDPSLRRESLKRLVGESRVANALAANPDRRKDLLQETLEAYLFGNGKAIEQQSIRELQASLQVCDWLNGILPVPSVEDLRRRIEREAFLRPFRDLVGERFAGREQQLNDLSDYVGIYESTNAIETAQRFVERVFSIRQRPPLMIEAPGGMGKSTLIAQFILIHEAAQYVQRFPFAYLDFDRPGLIAEEPITLLLDAIRQFAVQFPESRTRAVKIRQEWQNKVREKGAAEQISTGSTRFVRFSDPQWFYSSFAGFVSGIRPPGAPVLLVLDTFEEVQYRSKNFVEAVFDFLDAIQSTIPELRTVLAGRASVKLDKYSVNVKKLPPFDREAGQAFLEKQGVTDVQLGYDIVDQVGGLPLTLKLAARLVKIAAEEAGPGGFVNVSTGIVAFVKGKSIDAQLYDRILDHIHDRDVQKLAHPGLILRKITVDLIRDVLAETCGVDVSKPGRAEELFDKLAGEIALVESGDPGVLLHRPDVRAVTLRMLIDDRKMHTATVAINEKAIAWYAARSGSENRAEEIYHLLLLDLDRARVEPRAGDDAALRLITRSIEDLPERGRAFLAARVDIDRPELINWNKADVPDWELYAARIARESLVLNKPDAALSVIRQRSERTPDSPLFGLEIEALIQTGDIRSAVARVNSLRSNPNLLSNRTFEDISLFQGRLNAIQQFTIFSPSSGALGGTLSKRDEALIAVINQMIECHSPSFPVAYPDREEHFGDWVTTRNAHTLSLPPVFYISPALVSNELYLEFVKDGGYDRDEFWTVSAVTRSGIKTADGKTLGPANWPSSSSFPEGKGRHPVTYISYVEACAFIAWLNAIVSGSGLRWSLPPEDYWEFAARGVKGSPYPWGETFDMNMCNSLEGGFGDTTEIRKFESGRSPVGCFDMAGNLWEFVEAVDAGKSCVLRGGSFKNDALEVRSHLRLFAVPKRHRPPDFGFRLCRLKDPSPSRAPESRGPANRSPGEGIFRSAVTKAVKKK